MKNDRQNSFVNFKLSLMPDVLLIISFFYASCRKKTNHDRAYDTFEDDDTQKEAVRFIKTSF